MEITEQSSRGRSIGAGFLYFGVYLAAQFIVLVPFVMYRLVTEILALGINDPNAWLSAVEAIRNDTVLISGVTNLVLLMVVWLIFAVRKKPILASVGITPVSFSRLALLLPLGFTLNCFLSLALGLLPTSLMEGYNTATEVVAGNTDLLAILMVALIAPLTEEVVFRGLLYSRFRQGMPKWAAMLVSSVLFGALHGQIVWMLYAFCFGMLLCLITDWYGSLLGSIVLHFAFNFSSYLVAQMKSVPVIILLIVTGVLSFQLLHIIKKSCASAAQTSDQ
ncbi:MAG: type II CAAX endopeptidase family protein [Clostridia bacterium]